MRTAADNFTTTQLMSLQADMVGWIRAVDGDTERLINSGTSIPRRAAWHLRRSYHSQHENWTNDTATQFAANLLDVNRCCSTVNIHFYSHSAVRFNYTNPMSAKLLSFIHDIAQSVNKPLIVGEFGEAVSAVTAPRPFSQSVLQYVVEECTPLSLSWVWHFPEQPTFTLSSNTSAAYVIRMQNTNMALQEVCNT